jgi:hypothetical protein
MKLIVLAIIFLILTAFIISILMIQDQVNYFKMEINRSFDKREKEHWEKELAKLYFYRIPLLGKPLYKLYIKIKYKR